MLTKPPFEALSSTKNTQDWKNKEDNFLLLQRKGISELRHLSIGFPLHQGILTAIKQIYFFSADLDQTIEKA